MAAASYYDQADTQDKPQFQPESTHSGGKTPGLGQVVDSERQQQGYPNQGYPQQGYNAQNGGAYNGPQHGSGQQQLDNGTYPPGEPQEQGLVPDNRDTLTKWLDRIEKKFGGERFNNPANAEKNRAMNANILRRLKQVGILVMQRAPGMLMRMAR